MSASAPKISVGMPVFNGERYIGTAIESVLNQTVGDFELIIADNASTDRTRDICLQYVADPRVRYFRNETNVGAARNYNLVFGEARAPYFRWANADDLSGPSLHAECLRCLEERPDAVVAYGQTSIIDDDGEVTGQYDDNLDLQHAHPCRRFADFFKRVGLTNIIYGLIRTSALRQTALMGRGTFPAADTNLMAELTLYGTFVKVPNAEFFRRMHKGAMSWKRGDENRAITFWTAHGGRFVLPSWRRNTALIQAIVRSNISVASKLRLCGYVVRHHLYWNKRQLLSEVLREVLLATWRRKRLRASQP